MAGGGLQAENTESRTAGTRRGGFFRGCRNFFSIRRGGALRVGGFGGVNLFHYLRFIFGNQLFLGGIFGSGVGFSLFLNINIGRGFRGLFNAGIGADFGLFLNNGVGFGNSGWLFRLIGLHSRLRLCSGLSGLFRRLRSRFRLNRDLGGLFRWLRSRLCLSERQRCDTYASQQCHF
jgi:hypothetical protein